MKKGIFIFIFLNAIAFEFAAAQNTFPATGNAGVGTTSPTVPLEVNGETKISGKLTVSGSNSAVSGTARGVYLTPALNAAANNDQLIGLDIAPSYTPGSYTGVSNIALRNTIGDNLLNTSSGRTIMGNTGISSIWNLVVRANIYSGIILQNASTGSSLTSPYSGGSLWLNSDGSFAKMLLNNWNSTGLAIFNGNNAGAGMVLFGTNNLGINTITDAGFKLDLNGTARMQSSVVMGTGTQNASSLLDIQSTTKGFLPPRMTTNQQTAISSPAAGLMIYNTDNSAYSYYNGTMWMPIASAASWSLAGNAGTNTINNFIGTTDNVGLRIGTAGAGRMTITSAGNIGIGTATPNSGFLMHVEGNLYTSGKLAIGTTDLLQVGSYSLAVNGNAIFNKVKIKVYGGWSDYVFDKTYKLSSLALVEEFINNNHHLPGLPSAKEVKESGIDLEETQANLLKKIEELTLYVIDLDKKVSVLEKENNHLKSLRHTSTRKLPLTK